MANDPSPPKIPAITDADSVTVQFRIQRYAPLLPQVLDNGPMMNVRYLGEEVPAFASEANAR